MQRMTQVRVKMTKNAGNTSIRLRKGQSHKLRDGTLKSFLPRGRQYCHYYRGPDSNYRPKCRSKIEHHSKPAEVLNP